MEIEEAERTIEADIDRLLEPELFGYYIQSLRWALVTFARNNGIGWARILEDMATKFNASGGIKKGVKPYSYDRETLFHDGVPCLSTKNVKDFVTGAKPYSHRIKLLHRYIAKVMPEYVETFTYDGCEIQLGDFYSKFLTSNKAVRYPIPKKMDYVSYGHSAILVGKNGSVLLFYIKKLGMSLHSRVCILGYLNALPNPTIVWDDIDKGHLKKNGKKIKENIINHLAGLPYDCRLSGVLISSLVHTNPYKENFDDFDINIGTGILKSLSFQAMPFTLELRDVVDTDRSGVKISLVLNTEATNIDNEHYFFDSLYRETKENPGVGIYSAGSEYTLNRQHIAITMNTIDYFEISTFFDKISWTV